MLDRFAEPSIGGPGSPEGLPPGWQETLDGLSDALASAELDRARLARNLERSATELGELLVEVEALRRARASAESTNLVRGEILATVSRAMQSPADAILGLTGLLRAGALLPTQRAYVDSVHGAAETLLAILNDVSDFSKLEAGTLPLEPIPFDLRVMVEDTARMLSGAVQAKGLALRFAWRPDAPRRVQGDPGRIRQILTSLVNDAVGRTDTGEVVVEVGRAAGSASGAVALIVEDTGAAIPPDLMAFLFEPFTRGDAYPSRNGGLPLAIARQLARLMGGELVAQAIPGGGTRFNATLPLERAEAEGPTLPPRPAVPIPSPVATRLLVVEADADARAAWSAIAESAGYEVSGLGDRNAVLEWLRGALDDDRPASVVVFSDHDVAGYEELGRTILAELAVERPSLVMLPAVGRPGDARRLNQAGFLAYLVKPVSPEDLREVLETIRRVPAAERHAVFLTRHSLAEARRDDRAEPDVLDATLRQLVPSDE